MDLVPNGVLIYDIKLKMITFANQDMNDIVTGKPKMLPSHRWFQGIGLKEQSRFINIYDYMIEGIGAYNFSEMISLSETCGGDTQAANQGSDNDLASKSKK